MCQQLIVRAALRHQSLLEHHNQVSLGDSAQAVSHNEGGAIAAALSKSSLHSKADTVRHFNERTRMQLINVRQRRHWWEAGADAKQAAEAQTTVQACRISQLMCVPRQAAHAEECFEVAPPVSFSL